MQLKENVAPTEVEATFCCYFLQQEPDVQWLPHWGQVVQQVPHLPPEQQLSAA